VRRAAHAKANLALAVTGRREDGFHTLSSVFVRLELHDDLAVEVGEPGTPDALGVSGDAGCPVEGNLVLEAATAVRALATQREAGLRLPGLTFHLEKRIPMAAGLAGGSTDAATALDLAATSWGMRLDPADRLGLALRLGADVPFFVGGHGAALVEGVGERIRSLHAPVPPAGVVLVTPTARLATATVFEAFDRLPHGSTVASDAVARLARRMGTRLTGVGLATLADGLRDANDLWPAAASVLPTLPMLRDDVEAALGRPVLMTGSGSTLLALYPSPEAADEAATVLSRSGLASLAAARIIATRTHGESTA
jgi:4-diphosphocytidyl-2-C-methyl-D-erythritol kinase